MMFKYLKFKSLKFKRLNPKSLNVKLVLVVGIAIALAFLYFLFFYHPIQDIPYDIEYLGFKVEPLVFENQRIHFPYTDENNGESIIIKSDKKIYEGSDRSDVYFTVTNTGDKSEKVAILSYFPEEYGDISYIDVWNGDGWQGLPLVRGDIKGNMTKLGKAFEKKKPVPDKFDVKAGIQFEISAGHTAYFKSEILYPMDGKGEFWFEAFGDQGGYGLLDPIFVGGTTTSRDTTPGWYSGSWSYRRKLIGDHKRVSGTSDLSNFPILISMINSDFKHTSFGGKVASSSIGITGGGGDFVFTSSDGTTKLDHEIEKYASSSGEIIAWVEVPTLSVSADTVLYVYYGGPSTGATNQNKTGTWNANFIGVWHLGEGDSTISNFYKDSTSNVEHGTLTDADSDTNQADGRIGKAMAFNGDADFITTGLTTALGDFTACAWFKDPSGAGSYERIIDKRYDTGFWLGRNSNTANSWGGGVLESLSPFGRYISLTDGSWRYLCSVRNGTTHTIIGDGTVTTSGTVSSTATGTAALRIAAEAGVSAASYTNATIDEIHVSDTVRSSGWITTEYNNQSQPGKFIYGMGGLESRTSSTTKIGQTTTSRDTTPGWYSGSWSYRKRITIDKKKVSGTSNLTDFPILISRTDSNFKHTSFGGNVASSSAGATGGGGDFVFTSSDGTTKIDHEIEKYASSSGEIIAWVEVPTLSVSADTVLYVYYGGPSTGATNQNKTGVWDANYIGVWHLPGTTTLTALDSTSNGNNGTITGAVIEAGKIDGAGSFNGTTDLVNVGSATSLDNISQGTVTMWIKPTSVATYNKSLYIKRGGTNNLQFLIADTNAGDLQFNYGRSTTVLRTLTAGSYITTNEWQFVAAVWNANGANGDQHLYKGTSSGFAEASYTAQQVGSGTHDDSSVSAAIGNRTDATAGFPGLIDEVRISNSARSADWIKTEYDNQSKPSIFAGFGGQQKRN